MQQGTKVGSDSLEILNNLRAVAAIMVCLYHSAFLLSKNFPQATAMLDIGQEGVYVFFVISGMVMPWSLEKIRYRLSDFFAFMGKRIVRLHPPMVLSACLVAFSSWGFLSSGAHNPWKLLAASATLSAPLLNVPWVNDVYWTLFVEMQYYIYIALAFPLLNSNSRIIRSATVASLLALSFISLLWQGHAVKLTLAFHLPIFLMGFYLYLIYKRKINEMEFWLGLIACSSVCAYMTGVLHGVGFRITLVAAATSIIIKSTSNGMTWLSKIGEVSYSLYLIHWPIISSVVYFTWGKLDAPWASASAFAFIQITAIIAAFLFYRVIEKPALQWAKKIKFSQRPATT